MVLVGKEVLKARAVLDDILTAARSAWDADGAALVACQEDGFDQEIAANFAVTLERAYAVGWDLILKSTEVRKLSRVGQTMNAPPYTSAMYPWPSDCGLFAIPIVQLDLEWIADRSGVSLGNGLVQLWQAGGRMITRVIPRIDLQEPAAPIPEFVRGENLASYHYDIEDEPRPRFLSSPHHIVDVAGPYIFGDSDRNDMLERFIASAEASPALRDALSALLQAVRKGRNKYQQLTRLLGSFDGLQTHPEDHPPALFSSDDDTILDTGDAGVISLHFDRGPDGGISFSGNIQW